MAAPIEVVGLRPLNGTGTVKAFVDIRLGGVTIRGAKIIQQPGQRAWLGMPGIKTERAWQNTVELSRPLRDAATEAVLAAWKVHQRKHEPPRIVSAAEFVAGSRDDPGQHDTGNPAKPFDDEVPF